MSTFFLKSGARPRKQAARRLYTSGLGGIPQIDRVLEQQNEDEQTAREQDRDLANAELRAGMEFRREWQRELRPGQCGIDLNRWPGGKCTHGHYLPLLYCNVCQIEIVGFDYDREKYRREIEQSLFDTRKILWRPQNDGNVDKLGNEPADKDPVSPKRKVAVAEENKDLEEIRSEVDYEIWKESQRRGVEMNGALARQIAHNVASKFLKHKIDNDTILVGLYLDAMTPKIRERAEMMVEVHGLQGLQQLAENYDADKDERDFAKLLLKDYSERAPRFKLNDKPLESDDDVTEGELAIANDTSDVYEGEDAEMESSFGPYASVFEECRPQLTRMVASWRDPSMRKVGQAMLSGTFSARGIRGLDKSKASRLYRTIVAAFKSVIQQHLNAQKQARPNAKSDVRVDEE